jgi:hypothetical protein
MSAMSRLRKAYNYNVHRCFNCEYFKEPQVYLTTDSQTKRSNAVCGLFGFGVVSGGVCDKWRGK